MELQTLLYFCGLQVLVVILNLCPSVAVTEKQSEEKHKATSPFTIKNQALPWDNIRLPQAVKPLHYDLLIHPNLTSLDFTGFVQIQLEVLQETSAIILHSKDLHISKAELVESGRTHPLQVLELPSNQQVALLSSDVIVKGRQCAVSLTFAANLSETFHGFYKSTYRTRNGDVRVLASTQFEPTSARSAFPCFDEPAFKANFSIRIRREARHVALSNMPRTVELPDGILEDHFDTSVKMSTYLVAFLVSDFVSISKTSLHGVKISVYTEPEKISQAEFALDAAVKLLDFYEDYFDIPYPLPKQAEDQTSEFIPSPSLPTDLAAIPDFQVGAMENWGLTTYRESALLFDPTKSSASEKLGITMIIAHELAHQWFGNLVTMQWWNDLWLNEGFAKFMEFVSVSVTHPELQVEDIFLDKCFSAMEVDALSSSHPVSTHVENPTQIEEMFDDVSYEKGACVLNMLQDFLSADAFKNGIVRYLRRYSYKNTVTSDLWNSLTNVSLCERISLHGDRVIRYSWHNLMADDKLDVQGMMDTWTLQEGFPLISVEVKGREVRLSQERYLKSAESSKTSGFLWHIPLTYMTSKSSTVHRFLLTTKTDVLYLPGEVDWIKFNVDMNGYYIVHYEAGGWDTLTDLLQRNHMALSSNDRASLISSIFQLVSIGEVPLDKALDLSLYLSKERHIMPVMQGFSELVPLYKLMEKRDMEDLEKQMKGYIVNLFRDLIDLQSWTNDGSVSERRLRSYLLLFACVRGYQPCVDKATALFVKWKKSNGTMSLPSDVSLAVYFVGARSPEGWDFLFETYRHSLYTSLKFQIKAALTSSPLTEKLRWIMEQSLEGDVVKTQDLPSVLVSVSKNPKGYKHAWDFLRANWDRLVKKFELGSQTIANIVTEVTGSYSTKEMLEEVRSFFSSKLEGTGMELRCVQQALENIEENIRWTDKNLPLLKAWLDRQGSLQRE
uniref:Aminopeptidase n=1 Tax=Scleropages formosus TaxID=113540 RepID=A0A8C9SY86_SCLFO